jgi:glutathione S-transferase
MSITLYHAPGSPSDRIVWLLEELGARYTTVIVAQPGLSGESGAAPDPRNPHPHGYAPTLVHDGQVVTESGAIALYLTDLFPESEVGVPVGHPLRGPYLSWLFYQVGVSEPLVYMQATGVLARAPALATMKTLYAQMLHYLQAVLQPGPYLLGERFTAADVLMMSLAQQARALLGPSEWLDAYLALGDRPARERASARPR